MIFWWWNVLLKMWKIWTVKKKVCGQKLHYNLPDWLPKKTIHILKIRFWYWVPLFLVYSYHFKLRNFLPHLWPLLFTYLVITEKFLFLIWFFRLDTRLVTLKLNNNYTLRFTFSFPFIRIIVPPPSGHSFFVFFHASLPVTQFLYFFTFSSLWWYTFLFPHLKGVSLSFPNFCLSCITLPARYGYNIIIHTIIIKCLITFNIYLSPTLSYIQPGVQISPQVSIKQPPRCLASLAAGAQRSVARGKRSHFLLIPSYFLTLSTSWSHQHIVNWAGSPHFSLGASSSP